MATNPLRSPTPNKKTLDALETQLCFLRDDCAAISVIYNSLRNVYQTQLVVSRLPERHRELLLDYDDLANKVQQLERKLEILELEFKSALRGALAIRLHHHQELRTSRKRLRSTVDSSHKESKIRF